MSNEEYMLRLRAWDETATLTNRLLANLLALTFNVHRGASTKPLRAEDFLPQRPHAAIVQEPIQAMELMREMGI